MNILERYRECSIAGQIAWVGGVLGLVIILLAGIPNMRGLHSESPSGKKAQALGMAVSADEITSASVELRVDRTRKLTLITETWLLNVDGLGIKTGLVRNLPLSYRKDETQSPHTISYEILSASVRPAAAGKNAGAMIFIPKTAPGGKYLLVYLGKSDFPLTKGQYELTLQYEARGLVISTSESEEINWLANDELPLPIRNLSVVVVPPDLVEASALKGSGYVRFRQLIENQGAISRKEIVQVNHHIDPILKNSVGEPAPLLTFGVPGGLGQKEQLTLKASWPLGFILGGS